MLMEPFIGFVIGDAQTREKQKKKKKREVHCLVSSPLTPPLKKSIQERAPEIPQKNKNEKERERAPEIRYSVQVFVHHGRI